MLRRFSAVLLGLALSAAPAAAAGPYLITDLNTTPSLGNGFRSMDVLWKEVEDVLYFVLDDGMHGIELWRTDGTTEGTGLVRDLCPGACSAFPYVIGAFAGELAFTADDGVHGRELWLTDGTPEGTRMAGDLCPGRCSILGGTPLIAAGEKLFFATPAPQGALYALAASDGTPEGTRTLLTSNGPITPIGPWRGRLAFSGPGLGRSSALWWSDGTPEGTVPAVDLCAGQETGCRATWQNAQIVGDRIVFFRLDAGGWQIWSSNGTAAGTRKIGTAPPPFSPEPGEAKAVWQDALYYVSVDSLWRTDGTPEGTRKLRTWDLNTRPTSLLPWGNALLFIGWDATLGWALWRTQGTPETTAVVSALAPNRPSPTLGPLTRVGDRVFFPAVWPSSSEIWETDGTAAGTRWLTGVCGTDPTRCLAGLPALVSPVSLGGRYLFGLRGEKYGLELWTADAAGPRRVRNLVHDPGSSRLRVQIARAPGDRPGRDVAALGERIVFSAQKNPDAPSTLWVTDGTATGTREIGAGIQWPNGFTGIGDRVWLRGGFEISPSLYGLGLWTTDGSLSGTVEVLSRDFWIDSLPWGRPGQVFFGAGQFGAWNVEPWMSDGTAGGTRQLADINQIEVPPPIEGPPESPSRPSGFETLGALTIFAADDGLHGREPWITDGTTAGTRLLSDLDPSVLNDGTTVQPSGSAPGPFVRFGDRAYFAANDGIHGRELWSTDGTTAGTRLVRDLWPGAPDSGPRDLVPLGNRLYFLADADVSDALFTVSPTGQATRVRLLSGGRRADNLVAVGSRLFFVVDSPSTGPELWTSDGTRRGTRLVREIHPGALGSYPQALTAVGNLLLFAADDGVHGLEPWVSDGTAAGTRLLADLAPGLDASGPANFTVAGDLVGFDADDGVHGREMWAVRREDL